MQECPRPMLMHLQLSNCSSLCTGLHNTGCFLTIGLSGLNELMYIKLLEECLACWNWQSLYRLCCCHQGHLHWCANCDNLPFSVGRATRGMEDFNEKLRLCFITDIPLKFYVRPCDDFWIKMVRVLFKIHHVLSSPRGCHIHPCYPWSHCMWLPFRKCALEWAAVYCRSRGMSWRRHCLICHLAIWASSSRSLS